MAARNDSPPKRDPKNDNDRSQLEPRIKLWVEKDGSLVLSDYRVQVLRSVAETGSLAQAAQRMVLSYGRAGGRGRGEMGSSGADPDAGVEERGLLIVGGADELLPVIREAIDNNPKAVEDYLGGKE